MIPVNLNQGPKERGVRLSPGRVEAPKSQVRGRDLLTKRDCTSKELPKAIPTSLSPAFRGKEPRLHTQIRIQDEREITDNTPHRPKVQ